jgi:RhtB (resistance to homoserine/threonine) family protein
LIYLSTGLIGSISPGPDFFIIVNNCITFGRRAGIITTLGVCTALFIHVTYTILGFTLILNRLPIVFNLIQILGAFYLIWLGIHAVSAKKTENDSLNFKNESTSTENQKLWQSFVNGFVCNILNPKAALFFLSIFSQFITPQTPDWIKWIYGIEIVGAAMIWFTILSVIISFNYFREYYHKYQHWCNRILGLLLLYFAINILYSVSMSYLQI